jgi:hypothetical protein
MNKTAAWLLVGLAAAAAGAGAQEAPPWVGEARSVAASVPPKLLEVLQTEIARAGPEGAIAECRERAPQLARAASAQSGWAIRRVSLRNRNPMAVPDAWERATLEDFDRRAAAGEPPGRLEVAATQLEDGRTVQRYMRALPVLELCTQCHGAPERMKAEVVARLQALYPDDKGVGYRIGDIRGAITLKRTVP